MLFLFSGDHHWRTLALNFQNLLSRSWGPVTPPCLPRPTTLFLCSFLPQSSQFLTVLPQFSACLLCYTGHNLADLGRSSHSFPNTPQACCLLPTHLHLTQASRFSAILTLKWNLSDIWIILKFLVADVTSRRATRPSPQSRSWLSIGYSILSNPW